MPLTMKGLDSRLTATEQKVEEIHRAIHLTANDHDRLVSTESHVKGLVESAPVHLATLNSLQERMALAEMRTAAASERIIPRIWREILVALHIKKPE